MDSMNLMISEEHAISFYGTEAVGFKIEIDSCLCFVSNDSDEDSETRMKMKNSN